VPTTRNIAAAHAVDKDWWLPVEVVPRMLKGVSMPSTPKLDRASMERERRHATLPRWAWWNPIGAERPWTVGVEEEVMLLEPRGWTLVNRYDDVAAALPPQLARRASAETHACALELAGAPHAHAAAAAAELATQRRILADTLDGLGLRAAVGGTHPSVMWNEIEVSSGPRYDRIRSSMRALGRREPTFALHVHVAVPGGDAAVRALAGLRHDLPLVLALAANSPYWQGRDTGLASARTPIFSMFPRVGIPRHFDSYRDYVAGVDTLVQAGAIPDPSFLWWDARLQPRLGTVEVRIMDGQTRVADIAALVALVQCLVRRHAQGGRRRERLAPEALAENRFLAARDGMDASFVEAEPARLRPAFERLGDVLEECRPIAQTLGCKDELEAVAALAGDPGHARQRAIGEARGLVAVAAELSAAFSPAGTAIGASAGPSSIE
jgi:carboxylate-amine ligase